MVLFCKSSLRGATATLRYVSEYVNHEQPCHVVISDWVMRYGLYKLQKQKHKRGDWIHIVDHTIEFGEKQAFVVLGIPLNKFRKRRVNWNLTHADVEVMAIDVVDSATSQSVLDCLERVVEKSGVPVQIVSDGGKNIKCALRKFKEKHGGVRLTYDVTHATALILKHALKNDERWDEFMKRVISTKRSLLHTRLAYLSPPKPKDKARYMNLEKMVGWAETVSDLHLRNVDKAQRDKFKEKLSWLEDFHKEIIEWRAILNLLNGVKTDIKSRGLREGTLNRCLGHAKGIKIETTGARQARRKNARLNKVKAQLETFVREQTEGMNRGAWLGCSDIIESLFGSYKQFSARTPMKEVGKAVLTMPALVGNIEPVEVKKAMEAVTQKKLQKWLKKTFGETLLSKRKNLRFQLKNKKLHDKKTEDNRKIA